MKYLLTIALVLALFLTAIGSVFAAPAPGPSFGKHISCMATDCIDMIKDKSGTLGTRVGALASGTGECDCGHMMDGMNSGCTCGCTH